ncbi:MAG: radical SAM protein [Anaerolineales bacterium]|nr:radical SAM protein [Anaerolineales bacterium]
MFSLFRRKKTRLREGSLSFNLEPTFRCNLKCTTCPRNSTEGDQFDMTPETFSRICGKMKYARSVDLTGWGEPLLHPNITSMIRKAKEKGLDVSMTSNGTLLSEKMISELIDSGLDKIAVSVDGMRPETFEVIRKGALYSQICKNIKTSVSRVQKQSAKLEISLAFTIQEKNLADLDLIVPWMIEHEIFILHLKHLNVLSTSYDWNNSLLRHALDPKADSIQLQKVEAAIKNVKEKAESAGLTFNFFSQLPMDGCLQIQNCLANPLESIYFSYDGKASPCCHLGHKVSRYFQNTFQDPAQFIAGDIMRSSLQKIWDSPDFLDFRNKFQEGSGPSQCETCSLRDGK